MRLIDADALQENLRGVEVRWWIDSSYINYDDTTITEIIDEQPTIEAKEVIRGEWIDLRESSKDVPSCQCSICNYTRIGLETNFCSNCGADMRGVI